MIQLMQHQIEGLDALRQNPRFFLVFDPGTGKTATVLAMIAEDRMKTVVVGPKSILWCAWLDDAAKFFPQLKAVVCWADSPAKRRQLIATPGADVLILNYETFKKNREDLLAAGVTRLVVDESSKLRNDRSQISAAAYEFSQRMESVYLLSGTPAPNNGTEWYPQVRCIDQRLFGTSFWRFAYRYFAPKKRTINGREIIEGWRPIAQRQPEFMQKLSSVSLTKRAEDCLDLPGETDEVRQVDLSPEELDAYVNLLTELEHEFPDGEIVGVAASAKTMKLRQVTGGTMYVESGPPRVVGDSKLKALHELLEEIGDRQAVIWCAFTAEIDRIVSSQRNAGVSCGRIDGSVPAQARADQIRAFQAGGVQRMVCHPAAAGHGITLHAARYDVFYSLDFKPEDHEQARKRIYRNGQHWPCTHYYLLARNTIDERVFKVLRGKMTASEAIKGLLSSKQLKVPA